MCRNKSLSFVTFLLKSKSNSIHSLVLSTTFVHVCDFVSLCFVAINFKGNISFDIFDVATLNTTNPHMKSASLSGDYIKIIAIGKWPTNVQGKRRWSVEKSFVQYIHQMLHLFSCFFLVFATCVHT